MDKLVAIRIKHNDGTYSNDIPLSVLAVNIDWDGTHSLVDVLGNVDLNKGSIQEQINALITTITPDNVQYDLTHTLSDVLGDVDLDKGDLQTQIDNISDGEIQVDSTLTAAGKAADAKAVGDNLKNVVRVGNSNVTNFTSIILGDTAEQVNLLDQFDLIDINTRLSALEGGDIQTDQTLSVQGMAADAKATGDAIHNLQGLVGTASQASSAVASVASVSTKASDAYTALGLDSSENLFDPSGSTANLRLSMNQGQLKFVASSVVHSMYCEIPSDTVISIAKPLSSRFVVGTSATEPAAGGTVTQVFDVSASRTSYTLTSGANDKYLMIVYFHDSEDASRDIATIYGGIKVFVGTEWKSGMSNFLRPLSAMPSYMTKLLSYRPLGQLTKPYICLSCDDGEATLATATIPALKGYKTTYNQNIPVTFGLLNTSPVVTNSTYLDLIKEMVSDYDCSVAVHGAVTFTELDEVNLKAEINTQQTALTNAGLNPNGIIYPQHSFNEMVCCVAGGQYGVCCTGGNYTDLTYGDACACGPRSNMYALYRLSLFNSSMTAAKVRQYLDYIADNNLLLCAFWHDESFTANKALLDELVSYAISKGIDFIRIEDIPTIV